MQNLGYRAFLILQSKVVYNICRNAVFHAARTVRGHEYGMAARTSAPEQAVSRKLWTGQEKWCKIREERGFAMFGFLTFGTTLTFLDLACKKQIGIFFRIPEGKQGSGDCSAVRDFRSGRSLGVPDGTEGPAA